MWQILNRAKLCVKRNDGSATQNVGSCRASRLLGGCCFAQAAMRRSGRTAESLARTVACRVAYQIKRPDRIEMAEVTNVVWNLPPCQSQVRVALEATRPPALSRTPRVVNIRHFASASRCCLLLFPLTTSMTQCRLSWPSSVPNTNHHFSAAPCFPVRCVVAFSSSFALTSM
ncbi:hypothetical protein FJTKL_05706 [Diaporthe vaccinii]|uniref:Uncharacterized protein n=1 Tax=Diaporthe vaccinii TaxID=105482 RepID=A0ABR4DRR5_9PEZI